MEHIRNRWYFHIDQPQNLLFAAAGFILLRQHNVRFAVVIENEMERFFILSKRMAVVGEIALRYQIRVQDDRQQRQRDDDAFQYQIDQTHIPFQSIEGITGIKFEIQIIDNRIVCQTAVDNDQIGSEPNVPECFANRHFPWTKNIPPAQNNTHR